MGGFFVPGRRCPDVGRALHRDIGAGDTVTSDFRDLLKQAKLPERTVPVCLRGDLVADHEALERQLQAAQDRPVDSFEGNGAGDLADRIRGLEGEMREHTYTFRL